MPGVSSLDRPPAGLRNPWEGLWQVAHKRLVALGTWDRSQKGLLDEYVFALKAASDAREKGQPGPEDKAAKRALAIATSLGLTVEKTRRVPAPAAKDGDGDGGQQHDSADIFAFAPRSLSA